ncbi:unnamed protein product [Rotaria sp. Silwood2]|nr:unnamed protein product [Rotaria sp. Silwood2]CAF2691332.1 unnamed protein product [Rotaria sp. Silwood2]CAF2939415.1 unnamed protein product [Rotaria sp. Silwood2]CAF3083941.1 unnamed protein product [Rotaria sp. Silwood2]CAF3910830.1 unnamed protein product [Rotaria sp. Silwood2]
MNTLKTSNVYTNYSTKFQGYNSNETINSSLNARYVFVIRCLSLYALLLIIVGTTGNLLTIIVLLRRNLRRLVTIRYLIVVSICDTVSLYGWNLNDFYKFNLSPDNDNIEELSITHCRVMSFMTFVSLQLSSWCLTAVSLDRALSLYFLHWKQSYGKVKYTKYYISILTFICIALNSHILFLNGYVTSAGNIKCYATKSNAGYIYPQWERVHLVVYNLCPFAIMCICNTYIIVITVRSSRQQTESTAPTVQRKNIERYRQLTALLIIVTFAFVLLTLPACIYFVFFRHNLEAKTERTYRYMIQISLNSVQFTSHGINFFLYCFSAKSFLNELNDMFNECLGCCQGSDEQWSFIGIRTNHQYNEPTLEHQRTDHEREMQIKHYKFNFFPEFQSASEPQSS